MVSRPTKEQMEALREAKRQARRAYSEAWHTRYPLVGLVTWLAFSAFHFVLAGASEHWAQRIWYLACGVFMGVVGIGGSALYWQDQETWCPPNEEGAA